MTLRCPFLPSSLLYLQLNGLPELEPHNIGTGALEIMDEAALKKAVTWERAWVNTASTTREEQTLKPGSHMPQSELIFHPSFITVVPQVYLPCIPGELEKGCQTVSFCTFSLEAKYPSINRQNPGNPLPVFASFVTCKGSINKHGKSVAASFGFALCLNKGASTDSIILCLQS